MAEPAVLWAHLLSIFSVSWLPHWGQETVSSLAKTSSSKVPPHLFQRNSYMGMGISSIYAEGCAGSAPSALPASSSPGMPAPAWSISLRISGFV